jgi:hypothetical protein
MHAAMLAHRRFLGFSHYTATSLPATLSNPAAQPAVTLTKTLSRNLPAETAEVGLRVVSWSLGLLVNRAPVSALIR